MYKTRTKKRKIRASNWYSIITQYQAIFSITNLYQWGDCGRGFSDTIVPISLPMLVVARRWLLSSVSSVIRFVFKVVLLYSSKCNLLSYMSHVCACKLPNTVCRNISVWGMYFCWQISWSSLQLLKNVMFVLINSLLQHIHNIKSILKKLADHMWPVGL